MKLKIKSLALIAGLMLAAAGAQAHGNQGHGYIRGYQHNHHGRGYEARKVVVIQPAAQHSCGYARPREQRIVERVVVRPGISLQLAFKL